MVVVGYELLIASVIVEFVTLRLVCRKAQILVPVLIPERGEREQIATVSKLLPWHIVLNGTVAIHEAMDDGVLAEPVRVPQTLLLVPWVQIVIRQQKFAYDCTVLLSVLRGKEAMLAQVRASGKTDLLRAVHLVTVDHVIAKEAPCQSNAVFTCVNIAQYAPFTILVGHEPVLQLRHRVRFEKIQINALDILDHLQTEQ